MYHARFFADFNDIKSAKFRALLYFHCRLEKSLTVKVGVSPNLINILRKLGTVNDDDLIPWHSILLDLIVPVILRKMELEFIQSPRCLIVEINITVEDFHSDETSCFMSRRIQNRIDFATKCL